MQLRSALLAATLLATPLVASAQPVTGLYVGAGAGINATQKTHIKNWFEPNFFGSQPAAGEAKGSIGFAGVVSLGWGFGNGLRAEIEGDYRNNHNSNFTGTLVPVGGGSSNRQTYGFMGNVIYDFVGLTPYVQPYLGLGAGWQAINENFHAYNLTTLTTTTGPGPTTNSLFPGGGQFHTHSTEGSFAYQVIAGAAWPLPVPGLALTAEYRFLGTATDRTYSGSSQATIAHSTPNPTPPGGTTNTTTFTSGPGSVKFGPAYNHSVLIGLRYNFGVAPPPPPAPAPVPAQAPARSYLVFFDWDKATLTDRARQIIREAADNSTRVQYTRIEVNGYTDTSGTPKYNQGLSVRRARAVQAELIKDGVPANAITIQGFGDTHLLVPTGPGVREPQNRRVEIIIR
jgi:outer membrane protein OmpA-like peptidoglycan-associated protein